MFQDWRGRVEKVGGHEVKDSEGLIMGLLSWNM
jgi:hypothetical protein